MLYKSVSTALLAGAIVGWLGATFVDAGDGCCTKCGRQCEVTRICRRVEDKKKITVTCWGVEEEDFCLPGPSTPGCEHCEEACESDGCRLHGCARSLVWRDWLPSDRAKVFTRKKLMKRTVTRTVPSDKWVVEDLCAGCRGASK